MTRAEVANKLALHYSDKLHGSVWCVYDTQKRAYCVRGERLPPHPGLTAQYPSGWSLLQYIKPAKARAIIAEGY